MATELRNGEKAPWFSLKDAEGKPVGLGDFRGKKLILYFYPKDDTPGCTIEACSFRDDFNEFKKMGVEIIGVSLDGAESHRKFAEKFKLNFPLLCDTDASVSKKYGVYAKKNSYGRKYWGIRRSTFVIDGNGKILKAMYGVKPEGHSKELMELLKGT